MHRHQQKLVADVLTVIVPDSGAGPTARRISETPKPTTCRTPPIFLNIYHYATTNAIERIQIELIVD